MVSQIVQGFINNFKVSGLIYNETFSEVGNVISTIAGNVFSATGLFATGAVIGGSYYTYKWLSNQQNLKDPEIILNISIAQKLKLNPYKMNEFETGIVEWCKEKKPFWGMGVTTYF